MLKPIHEGGRKSGNRFDVRSQAFSLIEIVISLGLIAFVLVALLGLSSVGMQSLRDSGHDTVTGEIFKDVRKRILGTPLPTVASGTRTIVLYYTVDGLWLDQSEPSMVARNFYRVEVQLKPYAANTAPLNVGDEGMGIALLTAQWPAQPVANGNLTSAPSSENVRRITLLLASGATREWTRLDPTYQRELAF